jgi:hypothetical protein
MRNNGGLLEKPGKLGKLNIWAWLRSWMAAFLDGCVLVRKTGKTEKTGYMGLSFIYFWF